MPVTIVKDKRARKLFKKAHNRASALNNTKLVSGRGRKEDGTGSYIDCGDVSDSSTHLIAAISGWVQYQSGSGAYVLEVASGQIIKQDGTDWAFGGGWTGQIYLNTLDKLESYNLEWVQVWIIPTTPLYCDAVTIAKAPSAPGFGAIKHCDWQFWTSVPTEQDRLNVNMNPELLAWQFRSSKMVASDLVAHYKLIEGAGEIAYDSSGNGNHATVYNNGATKWSTGIEVVPQTALMAFSEKAIFDGVNDSAQFGTPISFSTGESINLWVTPYDLASGTFNSLFGLDDTKSYMRFENANETEGLEFETDTNGSLYKLDAGETIFTENVRVMITLAWNLDKTMDMFINGVLKATSAIANDTSMTITYLGGGYIGAKLDGMVDEFSHWGTVFNAAKSLELFNSFDVTAHSMVAFLAGYWRNDGIATWTDREGSNNATLNGSPESILIPEDTNNAGFDILGNAINHPKLRGYNFIGDGNLSAGALLEDIKTLTVSFTPYLEDQNIINCDDDSHVLSMNNVLGTDYTVRNKNGVLVPIAHEVRKADGSTVAIPDWIRQASSTPGSIGFVDEEYVVNGVSGASEVLILNQKNVMSIKSATAFTATNFITFLTFKGVIHAIKTNKGEVSDILLIKNHRTLLKKG